MADELPPADHEQWLVGHVLTRFDLYATEPSGTLLDELYVLIGALKVVGLETSYAAMRARLADIVNTREPESGEAPETDAAPALSARTARVLHRVVPRAGGARRPVESAEIAAQLLRPDAKTVAIIGPAGAGRTALLGEVAAQLARSENPLPMWRLDPELAVSSAHSSVSAVLDDVDAPAAIVIDDLDELADLGTAEPDKRLLEAVSDARFHPHARLVIVLDRRYASRLAVLNQALDAELVKVAMDVLPSDELEIVTADGARRRAEAAGLSVADGVVAASLAPATALDSLAHPGLALDRIDAAIGRALVSEDTEVHARHLLSTGVAAAVSADRRDLRAHLLERVRGQDLAVERVASRLALTRLGLDLRPERPNGVFLFAGPTGVGKTELAQQIAIAEYGGIDSLIRLDMSEYGDPVLAKARLVGSAPGYVGYSEPESWLTTRVAARPRSVVLLDEIEKAHPAIWNVFLQVLDAGRLTDGRGTSVSFADTIVILTSNLGVRESRSQAGFGEQAASGSRRQLAAIRDELPPELLNRLDEVIIFEPLDEAVIAEIAADELSRVVRRLDVAGWEVSYGDDVVDWLAVHGYDRDFGARHLHRNIEREFLAQLADRRPGAVRVAVVDDRLRVIGGAEDPERAR